MLRLSWKTVRAVGRGLGAGRSGKVSPRAASLFRTWRATSVDISSAIIYTPPKAAMRVGGSRKMGAMAAGFLAHLELSSAAGCPL
jgi:hypothetical protein